MVNRDKRDEEATQRRYQASHIPCYVSPRPLPSFYLTKYKVYVQHRSVRGGQEGTWSNALVALGQL